MKQGLFRGGVLFLLSATCALSLWTFLETRKAAESASQAAQAAQSAASGAKSSAAISQQQAVQTRQEAESAKEAAQKAAEEAEQIRKAADEALKKLTLYKDYKQGINEARDEYLKSLQSAEQAFEQSLDEMEAIAEQRFILWAGQQDSFFERFKLSGQAVRASGRQMSQDVFREMLASFNAEVREAEKMLCEAYYLVKDQFPEFPEVVISTQDADLDAIVNYAGSPTETLKAVVEEAFTFVPFVGSPYDVSRIVWDWRIETIIKPNAKVFAVSAKKRVKQQVRHSIQERLSESDRLFEDLGAVHTPNTLYAAYEDSLR